MYQTNGRCLLIDNVNRATIGDVNAECDATLIRNQSIAAAEFLIVFDCKIDNCDFVAVNLLRRDEWPLSEADLSTDSPVGGLQVPQSFGFIVRNIDPGDAFDESAATNAHRIERGKMFDRVFVHFCDTADEREVRRRYFELGSEDIGLTGTDSKPVVALGFPVASTSLPV